MENMEQTGHNVTPDSCTQEDCESLNQEFTGENDNTTKSDEKRQKATESDESRQEATKNDESRQKATKNDEKRQKATKSDIAIEQLEKSYAELRSAFTRKTQELSRLKAEVNQQIKQEGTAGDVSQTEQKTAENAVPRVETVAAGAETDNVQQLPPATATREEIIKEYLQSVASKTAPPVIANPANDFAFTNLGDAKSISQVEKLVANFFSTKGKGG